MVVGASRRQYDAVVVGSGPNGLAAAVQLARAGRSVLVVEGADVAGGGARSEPLTLPGFIHDVCSTVHPLGVASPFLRQLPLAVHGLEWIEPPVAVAHPFDDGTAALLERSLGATARRLGRDGAAYHALMRPFLPQWEKLFAETLGPILHLPRHPLLLARFGLRALWPVTLLARTLFKEAPARALLAGITGHVTLPLDQPPSAAFGLMLGLAGHAVGWPFARGGSSSIAAALISYLRSLDGDVLTGTPIHSLDQLPPAKATLLDMTPDQLLKLGGAALPEGYRRQLQHFQYGLGTFKVDWALDGPIPWRAAECSLAGTVHLGGTLEEIAAERRSLWANRPVESPFVLLTQPTLFDHSRAPQGKHIAWGYCHVPNGSAVDMTARIEAQIERFAPGFRNRIMARSIMGPAALQAHDPNLLGGDISGGESTLKQIVFRPAVRLSPYTTPLKGVYLCSASTPPGGGVHGMCGYHAARAALSGSSR
ncbi:MAG TPA: NAD(P)/FAD-dependent oxidoreductase [Chloroflexota bacterium]|jgi:phytoene dehydrogenase-like protein|nr:NAD(P)/FAD-dependent oxidoreductase [Chloroflexota bacterium]